MAKTMGVDRRVRVQLDEHGVVRGVVEVLTRYEIKDENAPVEIAVPDVPAGMIDIPSDHPDHPGTALQDMLGRKRKVDGRFDPKPEKPQKEDRNATPKPKAAVARASRRKPPAG